jgi:hypothetical protein
MSDDEITTAISRFAHAHERVRNLSASRSDDEIVIAYEERTDALLGLIRWNKADPVAAAILALVRAQDRLQGHHDGVCNRRDTLTPAQEREEHGRAVADQLVALLAPNSPLGENPQRSKFCYYYMGGCARPEG